MEICPEYIKRNKLVSITHVTLHINIALILFETKQRNDLYQQKELSLMRELTVSQYEKDDSNIRSETVNM